MRSNIVGRFLQSLMPASLLSIAGLAAWTLGPVFLSSTFGGEIAVAAPTSLNRPEFSSPNVPPLSGASETTDQVVLANWEYTARHDRSFTALPGTVDALVDTEFATIDAVEALFVSQRAARRLDASAASNVLGAYTSLAIAAGESRSITLGTDAFELLAVYINIYTAAQEGHRMAVLQDSLLAERIAIKAFTDISPFR